MTWWLPDFSEEENEREEQPNMSKITELHIPVSPALRGLLIKDLENDLKVLDEARTEITTALDLLLQEPPPDKVIESFTVPTKRRHVADRSNGGVSKDVKKKRHISAATRQKMSLAQQARRQKVAEAAGPSTVQATAEAEE